MNFRKFIQLTALLFLFSNLKGQNLIQNSGADAYFDSISLRPTIATSAEFSSFITVVSHDGVQATWSTASETNIDHFTLLRSRDEQKWEEVIKVDGSGTSAIPKTYHAVDRYPYEGISFYRIQQTGKDSQSLYSKTNQVSIRDWSDHFKTYPNPATNTLYVEGSPDNIQKLSVFDVNGREVTARVQLSPISESRVRVDISSLPTGMYLIRSQKSSQPFYKQ